MKMSSKWPQGRQHKEAQKISEQLSVSQSDAMHQAAAILDLSSNNIGVPKAQDFPHPKDSNRKIDPDNPSSRVKPALSKLRKLLSREGITSNDILHRSSSRLSSASPPKVHPRGSAAALSGEWDLLNNSSGSITASKAKQTIQRTVLVVLRFDSRKNRLKHMEIRREAYPRIRETKSWWLSSPRLSRRQHRWRRCRQ